MALPSSSNGVSDTDGFWSVANLWDRGFTVEGLTITYMPRGLGGGNADTMQQRARFFGYKAAYLGYCRVFLERDARQGFEDYVEHEEFMRKDMLAIRENRQPLQTWPRRFVLDPALRLCRDNVLRGCILCRCGN